MKRVRSGDRHLGQRVEGDVPEADLGLAVAMDRQADESVGVIDRRIGLGVVQGRLAVEENRNAGSFGPDFVAVPFADFFEPNEVGFRLQAVGGYVRPARARKFLRRDSS